MKKLIIILFLPLFVFSQEECGDRPEKPPKTSNQTNKEHKKSEAYLLYKNMLKDWKYCVSPIGISERLDDNLKQSGIQETKQTPNNCGDRPEKPKRKQNQSIDEYRKTPNHILYRQELKEWKKCMSPISGLKVNQTTNFVKESAANTCGEKPQKPARSSGLNHEEYRQTAEHITYRQNLKAWRLCIKNHN